MREVRPGVWYWQSSHPVWNEQQVWPELASSYGIELGDDFVLFDPLSVPDELYERATAVVLTASHHERDARRIGLPVHTPPADTGQDWVEKFGVDADRVRGLESDDLARRCRPKAPCPAGPAGRAGAACARPANGSCGARARAFLSGALPLFGRSSPVGMGGGSASSGSAAVVERDLAGEAARIAAGASTAGTRRQYPSIYRSFGRGSRVNSSSGPRRPSTFSRVGAAGGPCPRRYRREHGRRLRRLGGCGLVVLPAEPGSNRERTLQERGWTVAWGWYVGAPC
jgi:hypothetical protein